MVTAKKMSLPGTHILSRDGLPVANTDTLLSTPDSSIVTLNAQGCDHVYMSAAARQLMCEGQLCKTKLAKNLLYPIEAKSGAKSLYRPLNVLCCTQTHTHLREI